MAYNLKKASESEIGQAYFGALLAESELTLGSLAQFPEPLALSWAAAEIFLEPDIEHQVTVENLELNGATLGTWRAVFYATSERTKDIDLYRLSFLSREGRESIELAEQIADNQDNNSLVQFSVANLAAFATRNSQNTTSGILEDMFGRILCYTTQKVL